MSKKVDALRIESMNHAQSSEFHTTNIARAEADPVIAQELAPQLSAWKTANTQFDFYLKKSMKSLMTEDIKDLDKVQDDDLKALKGMARALQNIPDATLKESSRRVNLCVDTYKIETDWEYIKEMNYIKQMLDDLENRYAADVTALGLGIFVQKLRASNDAVRQAQLERENENAGVPSGQTMAWRRETEKAYRSFVEMLDARALVFGDTNYIPFMDKLNASISHYRQILAVAAGIRSAKKKDETNSGDSSSNSGSSNSGSNSGNNSGNTTPIPGTDTSDTGNNSGQQGGDNSGQQGGDDSGQQGGGTTPDPGTGGGGDTPDNPNPGGGGGDLDPTNSED